MRYNLPHGGAVEMTVRDGTNDHNVCFSIITEDEYRLDAVKPLTGTALDVGAHIGAATVALCALNPNLRVIAIEPIPANLELLRQNTAPYADRVTIIAAAAGSNPKINWNWRQPKQQELDVHRFIGNQHMGDETRYDTITVSTITLSEIVEQFGPIAFCKIDCEGCEDSFLDDPAIDQVALVHGEYHNGPKVELRFDKRDPGERPANRNKRVSKRGVA